MSLRVSTPDAKVTASREPMSKSRSPSALLFAGGDGVAAMGRRPAARREFHSPHTPRGAFREGGGLAVLRLIVRGLPHGVVAPCPEKKRRPAGPTQIVLTGPRTHLLAGQHTSRPARLAPAATREIGGRHAEKEQRTATNQAAWCNMWERSGSLRQFSLWLSAPPQEGFAGRFGPN